MKTRMLVVLTLAISLVSNFTYGEFNSSVSSPEKGPTGIWEVSIAPEGSGEMPAVLEISQADENTSYSGVFKMMGNQTDMLELKFERQKNRLSFKADIGMAVLSFDLAITGDKLEGTVNSSDGIKGKVSGKYQGVVVAQEPYKRTILPDDIHDLYLEDGNKNSKTVLLIVQGGPLKAVRKWPFFDVWKKDLHIVYARQAQDLNPAFWTSNLITFEDAYAENLISVEMIDRVLKKFKSMDKKIILWGASYGTFLVQEYLAQKGFTPDVAGVSVGRLDIEEEMWKATKSLKLKYYEYKNGEKTLKSAGERGDKAGSFLQSSLGRYRYTKRLANLDLTKFIYQYGEADATVGSLNQIEVDFLKAKGATVLNYPNADHGEVVNPQNINVAVKQMLELINK